MDALNQTLDVTRVTALYSEAKNLRDPWEALWQDCYDYALPTRTLHNGLQRSWRQAYQHLYDATAADAVDQLAACLLSQLMPSWSPWVEITCGPALSEFDAGKIAPTLNKINRVLYDHVRHSNFTVELHQALLDMVTVGTACLWIGREAPGRLSALHFQCLPLSQFYAAGNDLQHIFMPFHWPLNKVRQHFPGVVIPDIANLKNADMINGVYAVINSDQSYHHCVVINPDEASAEIVWQETALHSPFLAFRWQKAAGEIYGRSPVMKALPDIKTANKVVELVLKNASIAVTGIWQAMMTAF